MTKVIINGAKGRMGETLLRCGEANPDIEIVAGVDVGDDLAGTIGQTDVVIDFSFHEITRPTAELCASHKKALVVGTTGHSDEDKEAVLKLQFEIPIVWASNFSTGVNTLFWLTRKATEVLGADFDLEVVEMHHRLKRDAPSGTAATLAGILAEVRKISLEKELRHGREGVVGARTDSEVGMHSLRGGDVVGDHTVVYAGNGERLELTHKAASRDTFANGALRAASWACCREPGLYNMENVLGLE
ncbi:MAG TPA: 4-hydroxy-tetrahydrodipicolinate reductase [Verrucomicrobiota bacterium]|jgi:4-hydroxy-tetrahydrodipicolinate reductase|nr:4-hydroxy-tetrahydrodipicolinate reductase [Verrucomicrobiota bacterium]